MHPVAQVFVALAGLLHVVIFAMESLLFSRPKVWRRFLIESAADAEVARVWAYNQGFYNLFLALGALGGLVAVWSGWQVAGAAIALFACGCMALAGAVLIGTDRRMLRAGIMQAAPPLLALLLALLLS